MTGCSKSFFFFFNILNKDLKGFKSNTSRVLAFPSEEPIRILLMSSMHWPFSRVDSWFCLGFFLWCGWWVCFCLFCKCTNISKKS